MAKKKIPLDKIVCMVCSDTGLVPRMYKDKDCGAGEGRQLVACFKCRPKFTESVFRQMQASIARGGVKPKGSPK